MISQKPVGKLKDILCLVNEIPHKDPYRFGQ
jgi:hypothetical protein